ncbi:TPA: WbuC family cupin fold metalloprotein [Escherichia coli]
MSYNRQPVAEDPMQIWGAVGVLLILLLFVIWLFLPEVVYASCLILHTLWGLVDWGPFHNYAAPRYNLLAMTGNNAANISYSQWVNPGTYVRPHRHPHTFELLLPLRGRFVVLNFDDRGTVTHRAILGETCTVLEMAAGTWHAVLSLDTGGIIFEVKHGGYQPVAADDYAHWAPAEGEPGTTELMAWYAQAQVGDSTFAV